MFDGSRRETLFMNVRRGRSTVDGQCRVVTARHLEHAMALSIGLPHKQSIALRLTSSFQLFVLPPGDSYTCNK
jgi:hypothetical protein